jgi:hypothetical protein
MPIRTPATNQFRFRREQCRSLEFPAAVFSDYRTQGTQNNLQKVQQEFQQLGQDLQSGNLSAAQSDFASLQSLEPQGNSNSSSQVSSPHITGLQPAFPRIFSPEICRERSKTTRRCNKTSRVKLSKDTTIIITMAAGAKEARSARHFSSWDRRCNPAISRPLSRPIAPCSRTCHSSGRLALRLAPSRRSHRPSPVRTAFR